MERNRNEDNGFILRGLRVNRSQSLLKLLEKTGRRLYIQEDVFDSAPTHGDEDMDLYFFVLGQIVSDSELEMEFASRELVASDPLAITTACLESPDFFRRHAIATHWKDDVGRWGSMIFGHDQKQHCVRIKHIPSHGWFDTCMFVGAPKD